MLTKSLPFEEDLEMPVEVSDVMPSLTTATYKATLLGAIRLQPTSQHEHQQDRLVTL